MLANTLYADLKYLSIKWSVSRKSPEIPMLNKHERPITELRLLPFAGIKTPATYGAHPPPPPPPQPTPKRRLPGAPNPPAKLCKGAPIARLSSSLPRAHPPRGCSKVLVTSRQSFSAGEVCLGPAHSRSGRTQLKLARETRLPGDRNLHAGWRG